MIFTPFASIARLNRGIIITEKIDGTNACVHVTQEGPVFAGSRNGWITPEKDNFGFAAWVRDHEAELRALGPGTHFGEWWGQGIQRKYGLKERRFSLFNVSRWLDERPACCHVVPVIVDTDAFDMDLVHTALRRLETHGSIAAPGFMKPEGVVVFHKAANVLFKKTLDKNDGHKGVT